jgi:uncharacterized protein (TIGR03435 family)
MSEATDMDLVGEYARRNSEPAFAELVQRHVNLVYSVALRFTGNSADAHDIAQAVFVILAKKAASLPTQTVLTGWLYETTRFTALQWFRTQARRRHREEEARMQSTQENQNDDALWQELRPLLEEGMSRLNEKERTLLALRFYQNKSATETACLLGIGEWAAHKCASRALGKLRKYFSKRGVDSTTTAIAATISANSIQAAPVGMAKAISTVALAKGATSSGSTLTLIKGALKIMAWTKVKTAIISGVVVLAAVGTTTVTIKEIQDHRRYPWQAADLNGLFSGNVLDQQPPQVRILPSKFTSFAEGGKGDKRMGTGLTAQAVVAAAYGGSSARTIFSAQLPRGKYDFIASLPSGNLEALQQEVRRKFGVIGKTTTREADVMVLKRKSPNAPALKQSDSLNQSMLWRDSQSRLEFRNGQLGYIAGETEAEANIPVIDKIGITNRFDFDLNCSQTDLIDRNWDNVNRALDPLGLELVPSHEPITMLVVENAE